jgi:hypothetical protein
VECGVAFFAGVLVPLHQIPKPEVSLSSAWNAHMNEWMYTFKAPVLMWDVIALHHSGCPTWVGRESRLPVFVHDQSIYHIHGRWVNDTPPPPRTAPPAPHSQTSSDATDIITAQMGTDWNFIINLHTPSASSLELGQIRSVLGRRGLPPNQFVGFWNNSKLPYKIAS